MDNRITAEDQTTETIVDTGVSPTTKTKTASEKSLTQTSMQVIKRNGEEELVDLNKILTAVNRCCNGLYGVDAVRIATKTIAAKTIHFCDKLQNGYIMRKQKYCAQIEILKILLVHVS